MGVWVWALLLEANSMGGTEYAAVLWAVLANLAFVIFTAGVAWQRLKSVTEGFQELGRKVEQMMENRGHELERLRNLETRVDRFEQSHFSRAAGAGL